MSTDVAFSHGLSVWGTTCFFAVTLILHRFVFPLYLAVIYAVPDLQAFIFTDCLPVFMIFTTDFLLLFHLTFAFFGTFFTVNLLVFPTCKFLEVADSFHFVFAEAVCGIQSTIANNSKKHVVFLFIPITHPFPTNELLIVYWHLLLIWKWYILHKVTHLMLYF